MDAKAQVPRVFSALFACLLVTGPPPAAATAAARSHTGREPGRHATPFGARTNDDIQRIDINDISMVVKNTGSFAYDTQNGAAGLEFPKGSGKTAVFAAGVWLGALVGGTVRVSVAEYSDDFKAGAIIGGVPDDPARLEYKVYKLDRAYASTAERDAALADYDAGAVPHGAPPVSVLPDGSLSILGDQMLWSVFNDLGKNGNHNGASSALPLGVEVQLTAFAYTDPGPAGPVTRTVFLRYKFLNKGPNLLEGLTFGMWCDPDLGGATDDLIGCDVPRGMGYVYNAASVDNVYGSAPPSVGIDLLRGPVGAGGAPLGMTAFNRYVNGGGPFDATESYNALRGLDGSGAPILDPTTGLPTTTMVSGDPIAGTGWLDSPPSDRRMILSSGPVDLSPGESREAVYAIVVGQGVNRLDSIQSLRCDDDAIQAFFDRGFALPLPGPPSCPVLVNCPRPADYWYREFALGGSDFTPDQLHEIAGRVDAASLYLDWAADPVASLRAALAPSAATTPLGAAIREFAAFQCNVQVSTERIVPASGPLVFLDLATAVSCPGLAATTLAGLAQTAKHGLSDASYLDVGPNPPALVGFDAGLPLFGGGAGYAADLFGSSIPSGSPNTHTVEIRFTGGATGQYAYRYLRTLDPFGNRVYFIQDYVPVPFQVWDIDDNVQLNAAFLENAGPPPSPNQNGVWDPSDVGDGGREVVWVLDKPYFGDATPDPSYFTDPNLQDVLIGAVDFRYVMWPRRVAAGAIIDAGDKFRFTWGGLVPSQGIDTRLFELAALPAGDPAAEQGYGEISDCLGNVNAGIGIGVTCDRPTPVLLSLVRTELSRDRVTLTWLAGGTEISPMTVERRETAGEWASVRELSPDGRGFLVYEDANIAPGHTYQYRLRWNEASGVRWGGEASVVVPLRDVLSVSGFNPNPSGPTPQIAFTLASQGPATLTLYDVAGRRRYTREVGALGPGPHLVPLDAGNSLASGIYVLQLTQGGRTVTRRAVAIR